MVPKQKSSTIYSIYWLVAFNYQCWYLLIEESMLIHLHCFSTCELICSSTVHTIYLHPSILYLTEHDTGVDFPIPSYSQKNIPVPSQSEDRIFFLIMFSLAVLSRSNFFSNSGGICNSLGESLVNQPAFAFHTSQILIQHVTLPVQETSLPISNTYSMHQLY